MMRKNQGISIAVLLGASLFWGGSLASGGSIIGDAVFAHDFENVTGDSIGAVVGPNASKTSNILTSTADTLRPTSGQHIQAPNIGYATIDTGTRLTSEIPALSFSIFYNDQGSSGSVSENLARLLSSYNGTGSPPNETLFDLLSSSGRRLRFYTDSVSVLSTEVVPFQGGLWHHAGFVFDQGTLTFYFDGEQLGESIALPGVESISAQSYNWHLIEDARPVSVLDEYFRNGSYDEAALWYRALSASEMRTLYEQGFSQVIPEPSTLCMVMIGMVSLAAYSRRRHAGNNHSSPDQSGLDHAISP